jgi:hypothetical protein
VRRFWVALVVALEAAGLTFILFDKEHPELGLGPIVAGVALAWVIGRRQ